jgi:sRNA-binding protein
LKLRIQADIQQRAPGIFTRKALSNFLQRHTTSTAYLRALAGAPQRVDLDGLPAGEVAVEHTQAAREELQRRRALHDARRAAEREAQRTAQREARDAARREGEAADEARRRRASLLRAHETTTLTRKNFCTLMGVPDAELDALLAQALKEREQRALAARPDRADARPAQRGPRPDREGRPQIRAQPPRRTR